ncbi:MAG: hypothetical protein AAGN15_26000 [Cyanobacteria bacterium J06581_3]
MNSFLNLASENQLLSVLAVLSFLLLIVVTSGVVYLTLVEWRDKRRRGDAARAMPGRGAGISKKSASKFSGAKNVKSSKSNSKKSK